MDSTQKTLLLQFLLLAGGCDFHSRRIPNPIILTYLLSGIVYRTFSDPAAGLSVLLRPDRWPALLSGVALYLLTFLIALLVLYLMTTLTGAGGGDAKLIAVLFCLLGVDLTARILLPGCVLALLLLSTRRILHLSPEVPLATMFLLGSLPVIFYL